MEQVENTKQEDRKIFHFLPSGMVVSSKIMGFGNFIKMIFRMGWAYKRTLFYYFRKHGFKGAWTFFYVKFFVPVGEGAGGVAYFVLKPILKKFPMLAPYPRYLEVEITTICNKLCIHCEHTYWPMVDQERRHMNLEQFKKIVDQFPKLKWVNLTGEGSAFLDKDYVEMLRYLKNKGVAIYLVDHLSDITEDVLEELIKMDIEGIYVSLDAATKETYEKIKVGCNFDNVIRNLRKIIELKKKYNKPVPELCFRYVILKQNLHEMPDYIDLIASLGTRKWLGDGSRVDFCGILDFKEIKDFAVDKLPKDIVEETIKRMKKHDIFGVFSHSEADKNPPVENCLAWMEPYIMMGGYVLPCCAVMMSNVRPQLREKSFGNLYEKPMKEIWNSDRYRNFRKSVNNPNKPISPFCASCRAFDTKERIKKSGVDQKL